MLTPLSESSRRETAGSAIWIRSRKYICWLAIVLHDQGAGSTPPPPPGYIHTPQTLWNCRAVNKLDIFLCKLQSVPFIKIKML